MNLCPETHEFLPVLGGANGIYLCHVWKFPVCITSFWAKGGVPRSQNQEIWVAGLFGDRGDAPPWTGHQTSQPCLSPREWLVSSVKIASSVCLLKPDWKPSTSEEIDNWLVLPFIWEIKIITTTKHTHNHKSECTVQVLSYDRDLILQSIHIKIGHFVMCQGEIFF